MVGVQEDAGDDGGGDPLRLVPCSEEERREGVDHQVGELLGEPPEDGGGPPSLTPRAIMRQNMTRVYIKYFMLNERVYINPKMGPVIKNTPKTQHHGEVEGGTFAARDGSMMMRRFDCELIQNGNLKSFWGNALAPSPIPNAPSTRAAGVDRWAGQGPSRWG